MKKIKIFKYGDGELTNQLWNYISVYAYGLEKNISVSNPSFYEYHSSFNLIKKENILVKIIAKLFENYTKRKQSLWKKITRKIYRLYPFLIEKLYRRRIISSENQTNTAVYLPPTKENLDIRSDSDILYFSGWLFRNPVGIEKFRQQIVRSFCPKEPISKRVDSIIFSLYAKYEKVIGVHIRQGDYATFKGGRYLVPQKRVREIIDEYSTKNNINLEGTCFLITSDGQIDASIFKNINLYISKENAVTDLFLLSATDTIIGSDSSFGDFAGWYGNKTHIVMSNDPIDWDYYVARKGYFENKYCTMVHF